MRKLVISLATITALAYAPSLGNDFQAHDDTLLITKNPIAQGLTFKNISAAFTTFDPELYIPLTLLSYQIEFSLFGLSPFVFHLTSLLLHIGSAILVMLIAYRLSLDRFREPEIIAIGTGLLFALHPLNVEAVAWAAARKDALSSFFFFASLWAYLKMDSDKKWYRVAIALFGLGLLSKVSIVILPFILLCTDVLRDKTKGSLRRTVPFFGLSLLFGIVALLGKQTQFSELTLLDLALLWCKSVTFALWKFVWPSGLNIVYDQFTPITMVRAEFYLAVALVLLLLTISVLMRKKQKIVPVCITWFLICMLPTMATFWKNGIVFYASDRYSYIAMVGLCLLVMTYAAPYLQRYKAVGAVFVLIFAALTMRQALTWKDTGTTYGRAVEMNPRPILPLNNLGTYYAELGDFVTAREHYDKALALDQRIPQTLANIAKLLRKEGKRTEAAEWFERSIKMIPEERMLLEEDVVGYFFLGEYHEQNGDIEKAIGMFEAAALRAPQYPIPHVNLGIMYQKYRRLEEAKIALSAAVSIDGKLLDARYRLAAVQAETGDFTAAIENLEYVVKKDADYEQAALHLKKLKEMARGS